MKRSVLVLLFVFFFGACAGPAEHRRPGEDAALNPEVAPASRAAAGTVLDADDPLGSDEQPAESKPQQHPTGALVEDPVCHMQINPEKAGGGSLTVEGVKSYFCSSSCRSKFLAEHPEAK